MWKWLYWVILAEGLPWGLQSSEGFMELEGLLPRRLTHIDGKLVLPFGRWPQYVTMWILHRTSWVFSWYGSGLSQSKWSRRTRRKLQCLLKTSLGSYTLSFPQYPVGYTGQPYSVWEGMIQRYEYEEAENIGGHLEGVDFFNMCKNAIEETLSSFFRWNFVT